MKACLTDACVSQHFCDCCWLRLGLRLVLRLVLGLVLRLILWFILRLSLGLGLGVRLRLGLALSMGEGGGGGGGGGGGALDRAVDPRVRALQVGRGQGLRGTKQHPHRPLSTDRGLVLRPRRRV